ncbi:MAG: GNAT family N-acetyltransferase [Chloroflexi bacterium]|nr:GNAT family N-acetyltransferase [Chloroflexota bacterium]
MSRAYRDSDDLVAMQALISRCWLDPRPILAYTVGDVEWWTVNNPDDDPRDVVHLWSDGDELVGWSWLASSGGLEWLALPMAAEDVLLGALDLLETEAEGVPDATTTQAWVVDASPESGQLLEERGYRPDGKAISHWIRRLPAGGGPPVPEPELPDGYRSAQTRWPDDLERRVEVHRSAFAPSKMTLERYWLLRQRDHYGPERDRVIVAPDGTFAAFANAWWDPVARVGQLEPVGVHADHRRRGLGRAVCFDALRVLAALGAEKCVIFSNEDNAASEALYASIGAERVTISRRYRRGLRP